jgi:hypothetical protein
MRCSKTLPIVSSKHKGLNLRGSCLSDLPFGIRTSLALFQIFGKTPSFSVAFITFRTTSGTAFTAAFTASGGIPSGPGAFPERSFCAAVCSSSSVKGSTFLILRGSQAGIGLRGKSCVTASFTSSSDGGICLLSFPTAIL